ncbi:MAG: hypothetical protein ACRBCK_03015 [Alphaproteobacteria bacterium]
MSLRAALQNDFRKAAIHDVSMQERLIYPVSEAAMQEVLSPIKDILAQDAVYGQYKTDLYHQAYELRQICEEAKIAHTTDDAQLTADRNTLAITLQGVLESVQEKKNGYVQIDYEDIFNLPRMDEVIKGYANIYREFLRQPGIADALENVVDNIAAVNARSWQADPEFDLTVDAANDPEYGQSFAEVS